MLDNTLDGRKCGLVVAQYLVQLPFKEKFKSVFQKLKVTVPFTCCEDKCVAWILGVSCKPKPMNTTKT